MDIFELLRLMVSKRASDLHLFVASPPIFRVDGALVPQNNYSLLTDNGIKVIFEQLASVEQQQRFEKELELDFAYMIPGLARFRINVMRQRGSISLAFRLIPFKVPTIDELGLPKIFKEIILRPSGLVLVTGATGTGKSTTLAAMINHLNENVNKNVITIEDPVEYIFENNKCIIRQRNLGDDTRSFSSALINALRHDPDVIVVGEMRDLPTISAAITAAETGHLVLGTLHTINSVQAIDRIIDVFPYGQQKQIRLQLSQILEAVIAQKLLPRIGGGRIAAIEIVLANNVIRNLILEEKVYEILPNMEMSRLEGMQTMEQAMADLIKNNLISKEDALQKCNNPLKLKKLIEG